MSQADSGQAYDAFSFAHACERPHMCHAEWLAPAQSGRDRPVTSLLRRVGT
jgi:hypothetical protein